MSQYKELCPHCHIVPLIGRTNGFGGVYLECLDCGYYDSVRRIADPCPTRVYRDANGRLRQRYARVKETGLPLIDAERKAGRGAPKARRLKTSKPKRRAA